MSVYSLLESVQKGTAVSDEYAAKMLHKIPDAPVVKRFEYLLERCNGKSILDIGCTGPFSPELAKVAQRYYGVDKIQVPGLPNVFQMDIETTDTLPSVSGFELIIASEILEHLTNAGRFLDLLKQYDCPIIITVPNAYSIAGWVNMSKGIESVNRDHVAWYSYQTMMTLFEKMDFTVNDWKWYNGKPLTAEGLIFEVVSNG